MTGTQYVHAINLVRRLLDAGEAVEVRAVDLDEDGSSGVRVVLETGRLTCHRWDEHTQTYFRHGCIRTEAPPLLLRNAPATVEVYRADNEPGFLRPLPRPPWLWSDRRAAEHCITGLRTGAPFRSPGEDVRTDVRVVAEIDRRFLTQRGAL